MAWYDEDWTYRAAIVVDKLTAGTDAVDVTVVIPTLLDEFWQNVLTNGNDVRVCTSDGITLAVYNIAAGFSVSTRTGTIQVQGATPPAADCMFVLWLYWGNSGAVDAGTTFNPMTPRDGYLTSYRPTGVVFDFERPALGQTAPSQSVVLSASEEMRPWFKLSDELIDLNGKHEGRYWGEEIAWIQEAIFRTDADDPARYDETKIRLSGRGAIRAHVHDSILTVGNNYTLRLLVGTTDGRILDARALLSVRNIDEGE